jgi:hypothetical protein
MMARTTVWLVTVDKPGSGELPDGGETQHLAYTCATAAKRGAVDFASRLGISRKRYPWKRTEQGDWIAEWEDDGEEYELRALEVDLLTTKDVR